MAAKVVGFPRDPLLLLLLGPVLFFFGFTPCPLSLSSLSLSLLSSFPASVSIGFSRLGLTTWELGLGTRRLPLLFPFSLYPQSQRNENRGGPACPRPLVRWLLPCACVQVLLFLLFVLAGLLALSVLVVLVVILLLQRSRRRLSRRRYHHHHRRRRLHRVIRLTMTLIRIRIRIMTTAISAIIIMTRIGRKVLTRTRI